MAYQAYKEAHNAGDDGRPDWLARKTCNYMISAIDHCSNLLLGKCYTAEEVNEMKDAQLGAILDQLKSSIDTWDSKKCPPVRLIQNISSSFHHERFTQGSY